MALVVIRRPKHFSRDGLRFDVTVGNHTISILHTGPVWSGYGDCSFTLSCGGQERTSSYGEGSKHAIFFTPGSESTAILTVDSQEIILSDI